MQENENENEDTDPGEDAAWEPDTVPTPPEPEPEPEPAYFRVQEGVICGVNPRDESALAPIVCAGPKSIAAAVVSARAAQTRWAALSVAARGRALLAFQAAILARGSEIASMVMMETGKTEAEAWLHEVVPTADLGEYWSAVGPALLAAEEPALDAVNYPGKSARIERLPRGVVGLITPWNFPVAIPLRTVFPALIAGNAVVIKPSEHTPRCAAILEDVARTVFGPSLVSVVQGAGEVGATLIGAGVDSVIFTGSVGTGRKVAHAAADALVPVSLELGGKDAAIVLDDAPMERAARGILWGAMCNAGQNCASIERVYVTPGVAARLRERLVVLANDLQPGRDYGPLTTRAQLELVEAQVRQAIAAGATVLCGGARMQRPGYWYTPTVLMDVPADAAVLRDETFGPVVVVVAVDGPEEALASANSSRYGLTASVWTKDIELGTSLAKRVHAGVVMVNNHGFTGAIPALPWGGVGESGFGVTNSPHALDHLTRPRALIVDSKRGKRELWWFPYTAGLVRVGQSMARLRGRGAPWKKLAAFGGLLRGFVGRWRA